MSKRHSPAAGRLRGLLRRLVAPRPEPLPPTAEGMPAAAYQNGAGDSRWFESGPTVYGWHRVVVYPWDTAKVRAGNYVSIAHDVEFLVGGDHRTDLVTTFPLAEVWRVAGAGGSAPAPAAATS